MWKVNTDKVKGLIRENGETIAILANEIGISESALGNKLNGRTDFTAGEIGKICGRYQVEPSTVYLKED